MDIEIREADENDAAIVSVLNADVQRLHAKVHPWRFKQPGSESFTEADAAEFMGRPNRFTYLAYEDGEAKGYVVAEVRDYPDSGRVYAHSMVYIHHISVRPDAQRRGIGTALINAAKARGESLGITLLALDTWTFNERALSFFRDCGLVPYNVRLWNKTD